MVLQGDTLTFYNTGVHLQYHVSTCANYFNDQQMPCQTKTGMILLKDVDQMEHVDIKPYCLELEVNGRQYLVVLQIDGELNEWQDDVYMHSAGGAVSQPYGFTHIGYVGWEACGGLRVAGQMAQAVLKHLGSIGFWNSYTSCVSCVISALVRTLARKLSHVISTPLISCGHSDALQVSTAMRVHPDLSTILGFSLMITRFHPATPSSTHLIPAHH